MNKQVHIPCHYMIVWAVNWSSVQLQDAVALCVLEALLQLLSVASRSCALGAPPRPISISGVGIIIPDYPFCSPCWDWLGWNNKVKLIDTGGDWIWNLGFCRIWVHILYLVGHSLEPRPEGLAISTNRFLYYVQAGLSRQWTRQIRDVGNCLLRA